MLANFVISGALLLHVVKFLLEDWHTHRADISTIFLNGGINCGLYVSRDSIAYELKKILYGLKQSPQPRCEKYKKKLEGFGSRQHKSYK